MNVKQTLLCNNELYLYVYLHEHVICSKIRITIESQACSEVVMILQLATYLAEWNILTVHK